MAKLCSDYFMSLNCELRTLFDRMQAHAVIYFDLLSILYYCLFDVHTVILLFYIQKNNEIRIRILLIILLLCYLVMEVTYLSMILFSVPPPIKIKILASSRIDRKVIIPFVFASHFICYYNKNKNRGYTWTTKLTNVWYRHEAIYRYPYH